MSVGSEALIRLPYITVLCASEPWQARQHHIAQKFFKGGHDGADGILILLRHQFHAQMKEHGKLMFFGFTDVCLCADDNLGNIL